LAAEFEVSHSNISILISDEEITLFEYALKGRDNCLDKKCSQILLISWMN